MSTTQIVSATMGAMNPLLSKLTVLMGDEYKKLKGVRKQAAFLKDELSAMKALLEKLELMDDELDPLATNWRDHVREMSYDMENCIDEFMRNLEGADADAGVIKKAFRCLKNLGKHHRIANQIEELKVLALEASERRLRYKIDDCFNSSPRVVAADPRISAIYKGSAGLVGIDGPREEIVSWLTDAEKKFKVVSIVGFGGLGKTTLAKQVYDKIGGQFSCKAFVSVSQKPDMKSLLCSLQLKLGMQRSPHTYEVQDIIDSIRNHIKHKRYLIVIDDLWDRSTWNTISCAFAEDGNGGRVIVTTRVDDVALCACRNDRECIYRMEPLKEQDSVKLFFNRVFGSEDGCPHQLKDVSAEILKKCGGLPLAIITVANLLASCQASSRNEWVSIRNSLGAKLAAKPTLEEMRSILNLSYMHLPPHLRACFLYLGMYPEDHTILRDDLVRQWVAEGFVSDLHGSDLEDVGKNYFNELINRRMVQPETVKYGEVLSCKVHDMILDLIRSKCAKNNFSCMANTYEDIAALHGCEHKVHRLSLKLISGGATSRTIATNLSQVRSFARFAESSYTLSPSNYTPSILLFKYLRVLFFEYRYSSDLMVDLTYIDQLFQLRYLKVVCSGSIELPTEIQRLVHLETLKIDCQFLKGIPSDIALLPRLFHLTLPNGIPLLKGIRNIKSLRSLRCCQMDESSVEDIKGLGELTNLRDLTLHGWNISAAKIGALVSSIEKLCNLKYLLLSDRNDEFDQLVSLSKPPLFIEELNLQGWWLQNKIPKRIGDLRCLSILYLFVENLLTEEVHVIGKLPSLVHLDLVVRHNPEDRAAIICTGSFPVLECLELMCYDDVTAFMGFEAGAMPKLRRLDLSIWDKWGGATPVGMEHLLAFQQIRICMHPPSEHAGRDAESVFRNAAQVHPTRPSVTMG